MIDTAALKNRTLEQAFRGNITKRYTDDENARILYTKILNDNKISHIESVEELYEIPETWKWISLGNVGKWGAGATPSRKVKDYYGGNIPWLKTGDLNDGMITDIPEYITELALKETSVKLNPVGSVLIAMYGATIGKLGILEVEAATNQACCACRTYEGIFNKYLFYYLMSQRERLRYMGSGGAQSNISKEKIVGYSFPLAPYAEQIRVVNAIETIFNELDKIEKLHLHYSLNLEILKSKIIDAGIQGKLTEQLPEDGTAEELLEQIAEEKKRLVKEKKIKKGRQLPEIITDDKSIDIPDNWTWVRLGDISQIYGGKRIPAGRSLTTENTGHKYIRVSEMKNRTVLTDSLMYVPEDIYPSISRYIINKEDVYITVAGTIGRVGTIPEEIDGANLTENADRVVFRNLNKDWLVSCLDSSFVQKQIAMVTTQVAQPKLAIKRIEELVIPLPPFAEQERIAAKIVETLNLL